MRGKGKLIKRFAIFCFAFLFLSFIFSVCLQAQDQKNNITEDKKQQTEQNQDKTSSIEAKKETEEDVPSPDEYEDWVEPDDEQIYKFEIDQITPKEGLTGGFLIYFGHLIVPPYKIEIRNPNDWSVYINNIPFDTPPKEFTDKFSKRYHERTKPKPLTEEEKTSSEEFKTLFREIKRKMTEIRLKNSSMEKADEEIREYLAKHPKIVDFKYENYHNWAFKPRIKGYENSFTYVSGSGLPPISKEEAFKEHVDRLNTDKESYEYKINNSKIFFIHNGGSSYLTAAKLKELCFIKNSSLPIKEQLIHMYKVYDFIFLSSAKLIYYNFDCGTFLTKVQNNEK